MVRTTRSLFSLLAALPVVACGAAGGPAKPEAPGFVASGPVHFLQETQREDTSKSALNQGVLTLDAAGCLRVGRGGPLLVWPAHAALDLTQAGKVRVFDRRTGEAVRVGEAVALAGGELSAAGPASLNRPLGPCQGKLWNVDSFQPLAAFKARYPQGPDAPQAVRTPPSA
ncbi:MAG: hypothetical protein KY449_08925 [Proteobacteria bacterium]|nr:hypothetical protein [Pseudomonadota bacterium]